MISHLHVDGGMYETKLCIDRLTDYTIKAQQENSKTIIRVATSKEEVQIEFQNGFFYSYSCQP